jgi:hypothetical protein
MTLHDTGTGSDQLQQDTCLSIVVLTWLAGAWLPCPNSPSPESACISDSWRRLAAKGLGATANRHFQAFFQDVSPPHVSG